MKPVRLLLLFLGILVVVSVTVFGVALLPSVQRWAVLRAAQNAGLQLEVARVSAGWSGATLQGVQAEKQRVVVKLDRLEADFSLIQLLTGRQLAISRLKVDGLVVDASRVSRTKVEAAAAGAPAAAPGLLARVVLPVDLTLDEVRLQGQALLPGTAGQPPVVAEFTVSGGKFSPGREGLLQLNAVLHNPAPNAGVTTLRTLAGLRATLTPQRTFNNVALTTVVDAEGRGLNGQNQLKISAELFRTTSGESYLVAVDTILRGTTENVLKVQARLAATNRQYTGEWMLKARTPQFEPFAFGAALPDFDLKGGGSFTFDPATVAFNLQGGLQGLVSRLEAVEPAWRAFGPVAIDTTFDVGQQDGVLNVNQFKAVLTGAKPVLEVRTAAAIHYDLKKRQLLAGSLAAEKLLEASLPGLPLDWVRPFITVADVSGGEITGQVDLARVPGSATAASIRGRLQVGGLNLVQAGRPLLLRADVAVQGEAIFNDGRVEAPVLDLKVTTPAGDTLNLAGKLSVQAGAATEISAEGRYTATAVKLLARWLPGAPVTAQGDVRFALHGDLLEILPGRLQLRQGQDTPLLNATITQPFTVGIQGGPLVPRDAAQPVARLELGRLPLGLLPLTEPGTTLGGMVQQGVFELSVSGGKSILSATTPLLLAGVSLTQGRATMLTGLAIEARPVVEYAGANSLKIQSGDLTVRNSARAVLATLKGEAEQTSPQGGQATMTFNLEIPALGSQPLFAGARLVSAGRASGEIRAVLGAQSQLEARMTLNGLVAAESGQTLPVANLSFGGIARSNGTVSVQAPLLLDNAGRRSDMKFVLELSPLGRGYSVDGHLTGQQVELEDLLGVLGVFLASAAPDNDDKPVPPTSGVAPDTVAAWSRFSGQLALDLKSVTRGSDWAMTGLTGAVAIEPARLALQKLEAAFSETSRLAAKLELRFTGGAMPYRLTGDYSLNDFDAGRLFKAMDPGKPATVEGLFTVTGKLSGNGETPARALDRVQGDLQLTSRQGIFRGLQRTSNKVSMTSKAVELGASVLGTIFGSEKVTKTAEKVAGQAYFVDQLAQGIGEFNYDLLSVRLIRDELLNMNLEDISLVSPEIRLNGRGEVAYVAGLPLLAQPLNATMTFAARGKTEQLLDKLSLLDGTKDDLGYARTKSPVTLDGTLTKPDPTAFFTRVATAKLAELLDNGD